VSATALNFNVLSLALLGVAAVAFFRQKRGVLVVSAALFLPVTAIATVALWGPISVLGAGVIVAVTLAVPVLLLGIVLIDVLWAPFCLEMTYLGLLCWVLCPLAVVVNYAALAILALF